MALIHDCSQGGENCDWEPPLVASSSFSIFCWLTPGAASYNENPHRSVCGGPQGNASHTPLLAAPLFCEKTLFFLVLNYCTERSENTQPYEDLTADATTNDCSTERFTKSRTTKEKPDENVVVHTCLAAVLQLNPDDRDKCSWLAFALNPRGLHALASSLQIARKRKLMTQHYFPEFNSHVNMVKVVRLTFPCKNYLLTPGAQGVSLGILDTVIPALFKSVNWFLILSFFFCAAFRFVPVLLHCGGMYIDKYA